MKPNDFDAFATLISEVAEYYGRKLTTGAMQIYWKALVAFDFEMVKSLMSEHIKTSKFMPSVAELLDALKAMDGRPGVEEAWSICAKSLNDESVTIVWTDEMAEAFGAALSLSDDRIAARMAFKERYESLVSEARRHGKSVRWTPSLGHDPNGREAPLIEAVKRGRLGVQHVAGLLPYRDKPSAEVMALIENKAEVLELT
jgi:hypothetical protein